MSQLLAFESDHLHRKLQTFFSKRFNTYQQVDNRHLHNKAHGTRRIMAHIKLIQKLTDLFLAVKFIYLYYWTQVASKLIGTYPSV